LEEKSYIVIEGWDNKTTRQQQTETTMTQKNDRLTVAEGIMDSAACEYLSTNLASVESVKEYAAGGLDIFLTDADALTVFEVCTAMRARMSAGEIPGTDDWYNDFAKPLNKE
jgi:hypothetical protein